MTHAYTPLQAARSAADTDISHRALLAAIAPHIPMSADTFTSRCYQYERDFGATITPGDHPDEIGHNLFDARGKLSAIVVNFSNGNVVMWSAAEYLAYRYDPRF